MQETIRLRVGLHIEQPAILSLVQDMLTQAGHHSLSDNPGLHSLAAYLEIVLAQTQRVPSPSLDLLIIGGADAVGLTDPAVLLALEHLFAHKPFPVMVITKASGRQLRTWQTFPNVVILSESQFSMQHFFKALGRLIQTFSGISNPIFMPPNPVPVLHEQLLAGELSRIAVRHRWLDQRQEWLKERLEWLYQRQKWLLAMEEELEAQYEWLLEQHIWLEQERSEVEAEQQKVNDLRRWLIRYQSRIEEEQRGPERLAQ